MDSEAIFHTEETEGFLTGVEEKQNTILIVNDNQIELMSLRHMLKKRYKVDIVGTESEAKEYLKHGEKMPNLILIDINLCGKSGFTFFDWAKSKGRFSNIPVIFVSEHFESDEEIKCIRSGAMDYVYMPFKEDILYRKIDRTLLLSHLTKKLDEEVKRQTALAEARLKRMKKITNQLMDALAESVDAKDHYTNGHSKRVAIYSVEIARRAGKTKQEIEEIYYAAILHDVGKIGIPGDVIRKNSRLTDEEYRMIKNHTIIGAKILKGVTELPHIAEAAHFHHEKYDGSGYPEGLKGEEIPEVARLVAVADTYDAMTSKRSYRDILPQDKVRSEIEKCSGTQLDPRFAKIMLSLIDEDKEYKMHE